MMRIPLLSALLSLLLAWPALAPAQAPALGQADCKPGDVPAARYERRSGPLTEREMAMARPACDTAPKRSARSLQRSSVFAATALNLAR